VDSQRRISDFALISDCHTAALIADGAVEWLCVPRFDSSSVFAAILDPEAGGLFSIRPAEPYQQRRNYEPETNVLVTHFSTASGEIELTDFLAIRPGATTTSATHLETDHALVRQVRCIAGKIAVTVVCDPRPDYARSGAAVAESNGRWILGEGEQALVLDTDVALEHGGQPGLRSRAELQQGDGMTFVLHLPGSEATQQLPPRLDANAALEATRGYWQSWCGRLQYKGRYRDQIIRSALVLKGLTYAPTGGIVAAPTTSLPEWFGGARNWDYRYCWLRDSTFTLYALDHLGCDDDLREFRRWVEHAGSVGPPELRIAYTLDGLEMPPEEDLEHLRGFRGSSPVRIGNGARAQSQLDVYGELLDTAFFVSKHGTAIDPAYWTFLSGLAEYVCDHWREPDRGIWEIRSQPQHYVYSKVFCWVCLNRAQRIASANGVEPPPRWKREMHAIRRDVLKHGYNPTVGAFVQAYGSTHLDAANLALPVVGFISAHDPRMASTIRLTEERLTVDGLVHRYRGVDDGLQGEEAAFIICSFWLVDALIMLGEKHRARERFERVIEYCNDVGLLSEEYDAQSGEMLGNFPQAYSHLALITSALNLRHGRPNRRHLGRAHYRRRSG
jgi:GH15 family glucan-1,4-alpha-glucosidase